MNNRADPSPAEILRKAASIVAEREDTHGDWRVCMDTTAAMWSLYLRVPINGKQVALMNALQKICRDAVGNNNPDATLDVTGYGSIAAAWDAQKKVE